MENMKNNGVSGGIGFCGVLTIAFIILKLTGVITWSWLWVLSPVWMPIAAGMVIITVCLYCLGRQLLRDAGDRDKENGNVRGKGNGNGVSDV
jgi:hypothetical protein